MCIYIIRLWHKRWHVVVVKNIMIQSNEKNKSVLCYNNEIPIQVIQCNKATKHWLRATQINLIINNIESELKILAKASYDFLLERERSEYYGKPVINDISIENYIQSSSNTTHRRIIDVRYKMFKNME